MHGAADQWLTLWCCCRSRPTLATLVSYIVVLAPAINTLSGYALGAMTVSANIISGLNHTFHGVEIPKIYQHSVRIAVGVLPILGAMALSDISAIYSFTGFLSFVIAFVTPALLQVKSREICEKIWGVGHKDTMFTCILSQPWVIKAMMVFSVFGMMTTIIGQVV
eukprot:TRINITY_DN11118_c0_g1_i5.p1 TRINITY_DN11118_c0_g1~~TRINITY_DN11118_c0_g1_i5.p1  ORF type:complete len:165 (+),score=31.74 TRINITY_DN11118_c0_g1_i5:99-593(+)